MGEALEDTEDDAEDHRDYTIQVLNNDNEQLEAYNQRLLDQVSDLRGDIKRLEADLQKGFKIEFQAFQAAAVAHPDKTKLKFKKVPAGIQDKDLMFVSEYFSLLAYQQIALAEGVQAPPDPSFPTAVASA